MLIRPTPRLLLLLLALTLLLPACLTDSPTPSPVGSTVVPTLSLIPTPSSPPGAATAPPAVTTVAPSATEPGPTPTEPAVLIPSPSAGTDSSTPVANSDLPPPPTTVPEPQWPTSAPPTPFPPPAALPGAAALQVPAAPPLSAFAAGLRPESAGDLSGQEGRSLYQIAFAFDPGAQQLLGHERVSFTNNEDVPLTQVVLRLYPNFPGIFDERNSPTGFPRLQVGAARVGDVPAAAEYVADNTAVAVTLPHLLTPGGRLPVDLEFRLSTQGLGPAPDLWYFKSFYPLLAVRQNGAWRLDVTAFPDQVFAESSFYVVDWSLPAAVVLASSGTETTAGTTGDRTTHHIMAGPVREFAATASPRYRQETQQLPGITLHVTALMTDTVQAREDLGIAVKAIDLYSRQIGPYPFNDFDLVLTPGGGGGIEFPGYVMVSHLGPNNHLREHVVAHEVAHQWWYSLVGDDIFREAWLDEAFAEYTSYLYLQRTDGQEVADAVFNQQMGGVWPDYTGSVSTADPHRGKAVGSPLWQFTDFQEYDSIIYGKGAVFLARLHNLLGESRFTQLLQTHFQRNKYGVTTGRIFLSEAEAVAGADAPAVRSLYLAWVEGSGP